MEAAPSRLDRAGREQLVQSLGLGSLLREPDRPGRRLSKAVLGAKDRRPDRARMPDAPELVDPTATAIRHLEQCRLVAEGIVPAVDADPVQAVLVLVDPAL